MFRIGYGYDVHPLKTGRQLVLGGIEIPANFGLDGHSDADVLLHAISDALLGAIGAGDIGQHFPSSDPNLKGIDSRIILRHCFDLVDLADYQLGNLDSMLIAERPRLAPHIPAMRSEIARILQINNQNISIKATTNEGLGFIGRGEGIAAQAVVLIQKKI
jgi:2-C-methyl-D-erythritol 2,4-cyclodiphosphate synthase